MQIETLIGTINQLGGSWNGDFGTLIERLDELGETCKSDIVQIDISNDGVLTYMIAIAVHYIVPIFSAIEDKYTMIEVHRTYKRYVEHDQDGLMYIRSNNERFNCLPARTKTTKEQK